MTNDYRERLDQAIQTALVALLKYPPSGVRVDRAYGGSCDVTFTLPDAYSAQVLGPLYAALHAHEPPTPPPAEEPKKLVLPPYGATCANSPRFGTRYRGFVVCGSDETSGRFYRRTTALPIGTYTVAWTGTDWSLCADCVNYPLGKGSLDEALDRAKEMMR